MAEDKDSENVVEFGSARERVVHERKEQAAKDLRKQFQKAMGWNSWPKTKKPSGSKGPKPKKGKKR
ncbi:hypothetical protein [Ketobacter sp.]|uniref:hypothetical protein n=1 Tax=Ketobacter sp. TaxID=2083498 RepID=UPI000F1E9C19|nr:hypothetical protein [Ketobacter sp.]RLU00230.1 MAG: hypothetical protein D9N14_06990 [Ketobacter sp.]